MRAPIAAPVAPVVAAVVAAALGVAQVAVAEALGVTRLGGDFAVGADRGVGVQLTVLVWCGGTSVTLAVAVAGRLLALPAAVLGGLAVVPLVLARAGGPVRADLAPAVLGMVLLGVAGGLLATVHSGAVGTGVGAHLAVLWLLVIGFAGSAPNAFLFAGLVEPLYAQYLRSLTGLNHLVPLDSGLPYRVFHYHLAYAAPTILVVVVCCGLVAGYVARRTGALRLGVLAGVAGPVLAELAYLVDPAALTAWDADGAILAGVTAVLAAGASVAGAALAHPRTAPAESPSTK